MDLQVAENFKILPSSASIAASTTSTSCPTDLDFDKIPVTELRAKSKSILSKLLNPIKLLGTDADLPRDWRGVAYLAGIDRADLETSTDPMKTVLKLWCLNSSLGTASFYNLFKFLVEIDRWDVVDDVQPELVKDAMFYLKSKQNKINSTNIAKIDVNYNSNESELDILTVDDKKNVENGLPLQKYDALVIYADEDIDFVKELITEMEKRHLKLCLKDRDLLGGISFEHEADMRLISERCNRLLVIISLSFYLSPANKFIVNYAQAIGIGQGKRKIVPIICERLNKLQPPLDVYFALNYPRSIGVWNFWDKLCESIERKPKEPAIMNSSVTITEITESTQREKHTNKTSPTQPIPIQNQAKFSTYFASAPEKTSSVLSKSQPCNGEIVENSFYSEIDNSLDSLSMKSSLYEDVANSTTSLKSNSGIKKFNWYKKLLTSNKNKKTKALKEGNDSGAESAAGDVKQKSKRSFLRKKLVST